MIIDRLTYGRQVPFQASKRERKRGRDLTWTLRGMPAPPWVVENWPGSATILAVRCKGVREGKPVDEIRYYVGLAEFRVRGFRARQGRISRPAHPASRDHSITPKS